MNDKELLAILENGGKVAVPYFGGAEIKINDCDVPVDEALPALKNFLTLTNEQRLSDGRHLVAYCMLMVYAVGEYKLEDVGGTQPTPEKIWDYVTITQILFSKLEAGEYVDKPTIFVEIEGEVTWEPEHGLQMNWADGKRLVRVGDFSGHPTNGHAMANPSLDQYVYYCYKPELCTFPDPE